MGISLEKKYTSHRCGRLRILRTKFSHNPLRLLPNFKRKILRARMSRNQALFLSLLIVGIVIPAIYGATIQDGADQAANVGNQAGAIGERFGASDKARQIRDKIPRFGGVNEFEPSLEYVVGIISLGVPGFVLAGLTLWCCFWFVICRCCCNTCGGRKAKAQGYTKKSRFFPWLIYVGFIVVAMYGCITRIRI